MRAPDAAIRAALAKGTGSIELPAGILEISTPLEIPAGAHDLEIRGVSGATLRASASFRGAALIVARSATRLRFADFQMDGNRDALAQPAGLPPSNVTFAKFYAANGILLEGVDTASVARMRFSQVAAFAVLASGSKNIAVEGVTVENSGSKNDKGRNNTTGGILFEEGVSGFTVRGSTFENVLGNGVWTHSLYTSARNQDGIIRENRFHRIGRDAVQVGHATRVRVESNTGSEIGFSVEAVDIETGAVPVVIDTAGNVDASVYAGNRFEEINGKCIDLDGFHDGEVRGNVCVNRRPAAAYPHGHYGIVFNNSNPDMRSQNVTVEDNLIDGAKFGGLFIIGSHHMVRRNRFLHLNLAHCNEDTARFGCLYKGDEPDLLQSGIYLAQGAARPDPAEGNTIEGNEVTGWRMKTRCIGIAPGVSRKANTFTGNRCSE